jgi:flagellar biosynthesis protein FlhB
MSDKSEDPTPRRLQKAREEGDSGASTYAAQAVSFLVALALVPAAVRALAQGSSDAVRAAVAHAADANPVVGDVGDVAPRVLALTVPVLAAAAVAGAAAQLVQTGGFIATRKLAPKLERLDPFAGAKQLVSGQRAFAVVRALAAALAVGYVAYRGLRDWAPDLARLTGRVGFAGVLVAEVTRTIARDAALVGLALGAVDLLVTRRAWFARLKMSKDEVKREHKESEGDPQLKAARERAHHELLASATVANVRTASVVVVNPTHVACALRYEEGEGDEAPVVVASGEGDLARRIIEAAHAYGVPVVRDVPLARALIELEIGTPIPEALYEAVAEILREAWDEKARADAADGRAGDQGAGDQGAGGSTEGRG